MLLAGQPDTQSDTDEMADVEKAEPEYVPADYVAPADAAEQTKGGSRWAPVCDWPLAFREVLG